MKFTLSLCTKNKAGLISQYGSLQNTLKPFFPSTFTSTSTLDPVPSDERTLEISSAIAFVGVLSACFLSKGLLPVLWDRDGEYTFYTTIVPDLISTTLIVGLAVDNFYDAITTFLGVVVKKDLNFLPKRDKLPFGLGAGVYTRSIVAGLTRLLVVDTERTCQSEAAAFFAAYTLGLPCFAFQPNALEAAILMLESAKKKNQQSSTSASIEGVTQLQTSYLQSPLDTLLSDAGLLKLLVWLFAPVAMERMNHPQLVVSDPREAAGLVTRLQQKAASVGVDTDTLDALGLCNATETQQLLQWSYGQASDLIRTHRSRVDEVAQRLAGGAATVGECVAAVEGW